MKVPAGLGPDEKGCRAKPGRLGWVKLG